MIKRSNKYGNIWKIKNSGYSTQQNKQKRPGVEQWRKINLKNENIYLRKEGMWGK